GAGGVRDGVERLLEVREAELVGADVLEGEGPLLDDLDGAGPGVRAEAGAAHVELLVVGDDRPVDRAALPEHGALHEAAELAQQVQALRDGAGVAGALDVHVGAVAAGEVPALLLDVDLREVEGEVRAALLR